MSGRFARRLWRQRSPCTWEAGEPCSRIGVASRRARVARRPTEPVLSRRPPPRQPCAGVVGREESRPPGIRVTEMGGRTGGQRATQPRRRPRRRGRALRRRPVVGRAAGGGRVPHRRRGGEFLVAVSTGGPQRRDRCSSRPCCWPISRTGRTSRPVWFGPGPAGPGIDRWPGHGVLVSEWVGGGPVDPALGPASAAACPGAGGVPRRRPLVPAPAPGGRRSDAVGPWRRTGPPPSRRSQGSPAGTSTPTGVDASGALPHTCGASTSAYPKCITAGGAYPSPPRDPWWVRAQPGSSSTGGDRVGRPTGWRASRGPAIDLRAVDLAAALKMFAQEAGGFDLDRCADVMAAYDEVDGLSPGEVTALPVVLRVERLVGVYRLLSGFGDRFGDGGPEGSGPGSWRGSSRWPRRRRPVSAGWRSTSRRWWKRSARRSWDERQVGRSTAAQETAVAVRRGTGDWGKTGGKSHANGSSATHHE